MTARGIRANNPGNIRVGEDWRGLAHWKEMTMPQRTEHEFCVFVAPVYGIRALCKVLLTYKKKHKLNTVRGIISRYAPSSENNVKSYSAHVAYKMQLPNADSIIDVEEPKIMRGLVEAIILHENGSQPYTHEIDDGMKLAGL